MNPYPIDVSTFDPNHLTRDDGWRMIDMLHADGYGVSVDSVDTEGRPVVLHGNSHFRSQSTAGRDWPASVCHVSLSHWDANDMLAFTDVATGHGETLPLAVYDACLHIPR